MYKRQEEGGGGEREEGEEKKKVAQDADECHQTSLKTLDEERERVFL